VLVGSDITVVVSNVVNVSILPDRGVQYLDEAGPADFTDTSMLEDMGVKAGGSTL
jgi:hypothetical protein